MARKLAISDIHGCAKTFGALLDNLAFSKSDSLYLLGDFIDRGPDTKGVLDQVMLLKAEGYQVECTLGNHEDMLTASFYDPQMERSWKKNGGMDMLDSFGITHQREIPRSYIDLIHSFEYYIETEGFILVHAGLDFIKNDPLYDTDSMMWIRDWYNYIRYDWLGDRVVVHGHTPISQQEIEAQFQVIDKKQYLDIDNGCVFAPIAAHRGLGKLCCFDMTNRRLFFQEYLD